MNKALRKFISVFLLVIFMLGSGAGQLIHAAFHKHDFDVAQQTNHKTFGLQHTYCTALQLMLPEFSGSGIIGVPAKISAQRILFSHAEVSIPPIHSFKTSDRAPPFTA
jgi:hypothetical protein